MLSSLLKLSNALVLCLSLSAFAAEDLSSATDLQQLGSNHPQEVLLLMVSQEDCGYCVRVKQDYLLPLIAAEGHPPVRVLHLHQQHKVIDFDGQTRDADEIASRLGSRFTPTLLFVDSKGKVLHDPIIGLSTPEFYGFYLDEAIRQARLQIN